MLFLRIPVHLLLPLPLALGPDLFGVSHKVHPLPAVLLFVVLLFFVVIVAVVGRRRPPDFATAKRHRQDKLAALGAVVSAVRLLLAHGHVVVGVIVLILRKK